MHISDGGLRMEVGFLGATVDTNLSASIGAQVRSLVQKDSTCPPHVERQSPCTTAEPARCD